VRPPLRSGDTERDDWRAGALTFVRVAVGTVMRELALENPRAAADKETAPYEMLATLPEARCAVVCPPRAFECCPRSGRSTPSSLSCAALRTACSRARYAARAHEETAMGCAHAQPCCGGGELGRDAPPRNSARHAFDGAENAWFTVADNPGRRLGSRFLRSIERVRAHLCR
jgi:hypothetical protein